MRNSASHIVTLFLVLASSQMAVSDDPADIRTALSVVFAEDHVDECAFDVHQKAKPLPPEQRMLFLARWVLPNENHPTLRLTAGFSPTDAGPLSSNAEAATRSSIHSIPKQDGSKSKQIAIENGGVTVSPFFDLIDTALETNQLSEVRQRVTAWAPDSQLSVMAAAEAETNRQIALTLIEVADQRIEQAETHMNHVVNSVFRGIKPQLLRPVNSDDENTARQNDRENDVAGEKALSDEEAISNSVAAELFEPSDAMLVLLTRTAEIAQLREMAGMLLARCEKWGNSNYNRNVRQQHVMALFHRMGAIDGGRVAGANVADSVGAMNQWKAVSQTTAVSRGTGRPNTQWMFYPGHVELVSPHERDFLYFHMPMRGNFEVECDVPVGGWSVASLMVAGRWLAPIYTQDGFDIGYFRWQSQREHFTPPLTRIRHWLHYRTTVRNGVVTTYFNGRPVQTRTVSIDHDPWLAIRSNPRDHGTIRNLRISGSPDIPEQIELLNDTSLGGWCAYFGEEVGDVGDHWVVQNGVLYGQNSGVQIRELGSPSIVIRDSADIAGCDERMLRYHRPMLENGVIAYDFFYSPGKVCVHPALDRIAFMLDVDGVRLHQITDGSCDRTELGPDNIFAAQEFNRGPRQLPLKSDDWNRMELRLTGDILSLALNGIEIFERPLEAENRRTFGLLHFADKTAVQVRNLVWSGDWPRELPPVAAQELAKPDAEFLDADIDQLTATFEHDFRKDGFPLERFKVIRGNPGTHLTSTTEGLVSLREGTGGYLNATVAPALVITGDFDAIAEYDSFETSADATGAGTVALMAVLDRNSQDEFFLARRHMPRTASPADQRLQCATVQQSPEGERRSYFVSEPMEERSGRLRLARRGDTIYYLTAEQDSPNFRIRGRQPIAPNNVAVDGLRLLTQIHQKGGMVRVVWKSLSIRAEALSGLAVGGQDEVVTTLNQQREKLAGRFLGDFQKQLPAAGEFYLWSVPDAWNANDKGWLIRSMGTDNWTSSGISTYTQLTGDFDISIRFRPEQFAQPKSGQNTQIYLQVEAPNEDRTQINSMHTLNSIGESVAEARIRTPNGKGDYNYVGVGQLGMETCRRLRIARRGSRVTFLAARTEESADEVIAGYDFVDLPILPTNVRVMVHTGGSDRESKVVLESLDIRATIVEQSVRSNRQPDSAPAVPAPKSAPASTKGLLDRIIDNIRSE